MSNLLVVHNGREYSISQENKGRFFKFLNTRGVKGIAILSGKKGEWFMLLQEYGGKTQETTPSGPYPTVAAAALVYVQEMGV